MRHMISGLVAAVAVMAASPAMACGYTACAPQVYAPPVVAYTSSGCNPCGGSGWGHQRLAEPTQQYYYVNQGPTYSGPGAWAPARAYQEDSVSGYGAYSRPYRYGYSSGYGYRAHQAYRPWRARTSYYHQPRMNYQHGYHRGYAPRHAYAPRHVHAPRYAPHHGHHAPLRRYY